MKNLCENCGKCCLETEMILSEKDIESIKINCSNIIKGQDFIVKNESNQFQVKNHEGHCIFFDSSSKSCIIYEFRPQGCRFYPLIYDLNKKKCKLDEECPRTILFYKNKNESKITCKNLKIFLKQQLKMKIN